MSFTYHAKPLSPGSGITFTPNKDDEQLCNDFNELLPKFRNRSDLVRQLIVDGIKAQQAGEQGGVFIPIDGLSEDEAKLLQSEEGMNILLNVAKLLLGKSAGGLGVLTSTKTHEHTISTVQENTRETYIEEQNEDDSDNDEEVDALALFRQMNNKMQIPEAP